jgi:site-specific DNA-cytosine methylase
MDLFADCGGLSLGLEEAGFNPIFVNELHQDALIIASIITIIASTPLYYSRRSKSKFSEGSDTKVTEPMNRTDQISGSTTESTMP